MTEPSAPALKIKAHYEAIVVGGRLSGLIAAKILANRGVNVALIHGSPEWGQDYQIISTPSGPLCQGLGLLPHRPEALAHWDQLGAELGFDLNIIPVETGLQTFESGHPKAFLGFGDKVPEAIDVLDPYLSSQYSYVPSETLAQIIDSCTKNGGVSLLNPHEVTGLTNTASGWQVEVDAQKIFLADQVYVAQSPSQLSELLRTSGTKPSKDLRRLSKWRTWSCVTLTLIHPEPICDQPLTPWILMGSKMDPTLGVFDPPYENESGTRQVSRWISFLPSEMAEIEENCALSYKEMKKQIRRAFSGAFDGSTWEKITVQTRSHGHPQLALNPSELKLGPGLFPLGSAFGPHAHFLWGELLSPLGALCLESSERIPFSPVPTEAQP